MQMRCWQYKLRPKRIKETSQRDMHGFFLWEICCENWKASSQCSFFSTRDSQVTKCLQKNRKGPYRENGKDDGSGDFRHFDGSGVLFLKWLQTFWTNLTIDIFSQYFYRVLSFYRFYFHNKTQGFVVKLLK